METSVINCCEGHNDDGFRVQFQSDIANSSCQALHFEFLIRCLEEKYERALISAKEEWLVNALLLALPKNLLKPTCD
jgi:hypothetical protein